MRRLLTASTLSALLLAGAVSPAQAVESASFDPASNTLTMPFVKLDGSVKYQDVVIRLSDFGQLQLDTPGLGSEIEFVTNGNILSLPRVMIGNQAYQNVRLSNPGFVIQSAGGIVIDAATSTGGGGAGSYTLDIAVNAAGAAMPPVTVQNVQKPATQEEFCNAPEIRQHITQSAQNQMGTWSMTGCTFNGTTGRIDMNISISVASFSTSLPYSATYTYR